MTTITDPEALPSADSAAAPGELLTVPHWKAGAPFAGQSTRTSDVYDPADYIRDYAEFLALKKSGRP